MALQICLCHCIDCTPLCDPPMSPPLHCLGGQGWLFPQPSPRWSELCQCYPGVVSACPRTILAPPPLSACTSALALALPSLPGGGLGGRQTEDVAVSRCVLSLVCCSPSSFPTSGSMTCSTTASAPWVEVVVAAEEEESRREASCSCPTSISGCQTQTSR